jgi:hypothetical protein
MLRLVSIIVPLSITVLFAACENATAYQLQKSKAEKNEDKKKRDDVKRFLEL